MKTYLLPTDFNINTLAALDILALEYRVKDAKVVFVHALKLSDSINDMLMLSRRSRDYDAIDESFFDALTNYKQKYAGSFSQISIEYFYGSTTVAFKNFLDAHDVDIIIDLKNYPFKAINKLSIDPKFLIARSGYQVLTIDINAVTIEQDLASSKIEEPATATRFA